MGFLGRQYGWARDKSTQATSSQVHPPYVMDEAYRMRGFIQLARLGLAATFALSAAGCPDEPKKMTRYACTCAFLTDTDDTSTQRVEICESNDDRAKQAAAGCAQSGAPATVQGCECKSSPNQSSCRAGDCTVHEHR